jgi:hypothetical protein
MTKSKKKADEFIVVDGDYPKSKVVGFHGFKPVMSESGKPVEMTFDQANAVVKQFSRTAEFRPFLIAMEKPARRLTNATARRKLAVVNSKK